MFNSVVVDVGIGLIFVYLVLGLMCTTVHEWIAQCLKMRATTLKAGIEALLNGIAKKDSADKNAPPTANTASNALTPLADAFYDHGFIKSLSKRGGDPSYVPKSTFATALIDILEKWSQTVNQAQPSSPSQPPSPGPPADAGGAHAVPATLAQIKSSIEALPPGHTKESLQLLLKKANDDIEMFQKQLEDWFENAMDRISGWYKKKSQIITFIVAAGITIFANADSVQIARKLFLNPVLRDKIVGEASKRRAMGVNAEYSDTTANPTPPTVAESQTSQATDLTAEEKADLGELTGWSSEFKTYHVMKARKDNKNESEIEKAGKDDSFPGLDLLYYQSMFWCWLWAIAPGHLLGWILTAIAVSLGAPFWFDTLNKFMNIRAAGTAPNEKNKDTSKA